MVLPFSLVRPAGRMPFVLRMPEVPHGTRVTLGTRQLRKSFRASSGPGRCPVPATRLDYLMCVTRPVSDSHNNVGSWVPVLWDVPNQRE